MDAPPTAGMLTLHTLGEVPRARATLIEHAASRGFDEQSVFAIRLAVEEALTNALRHGNGSDPQRTVTVDYAVNDERCQVTVCDEGGGFAPDALPDPTMCENLERPHGRGVMLMRAYMTRVSFNQAGNCVTLVKERPTTESGR